MEKNLLFLPELQKFFQSLKIRFAINFRHWSELKQQLQRLMNATVFLSDICKN